MSSRADCAARRRKHRAVVLACLVGLVVVGAVSWRPSEEGILPWSTFSITSEGIGASGPVTVSGSQDKDGLTALTVKAFDREMKVTDEQLKQVRGFAANGMQLSYEEGYEQTGGRTVYVKLLRGFVSGVRDSRLLTVRDHGGVSVEDLKKK
jgi:hypothetical protein